MYSLASRNATKTAVDINQVEIALITAANLLFFYNVCQTIHAKSKKLFLWKYAIIVVSLY